MGRWDTLPLLGSHIPDMEWTPEEKMRAGPLIAKKIRWVWDPGTAVPVAAWDLGRFESAALHDVIR